MPSSAPKALTINIRTYIRIPTRITANTLHRHEVRCSKDPHCKGLPQPTYWKVPLMAIIRGKLFSAAYSGSIVFDPGVPSGSADIATTRSGVLLMSCPNTC